ncbi:hypothetical protein BV25DRAFT_70964 [Artomyces pyxidatus]|uniref:Uncharacterized protein n=1 Tax=Artomyces pyxidatus TaxID=48021 RepID=A0ACB8TKQ8_9AGAM|nr:hypothetical protein BV25DRAFT_70964 [Artomyces pyxidatus]
MSASTESTRTPDAPPIGDRVHKPTQAIRVGVSRALARHACAAAGLSTMLTTRTARHVTDALMHCQSMPPRHVRAAVDPGTARTHERARDIPSSSGKLMRRVARSSAIDFWSMPPSRRTMALPNLRPRAVSVRADLRRPFGILLEIVLAFPGPTVCNYSQYAHTKGPSLTPKRTATRTLLYMRHVGGRSLASCSRHIPLLAIPRRSLLSPREFGQVGPLRAYLG